MSDDPNAKSTEPAQPVAVGIVEHWCEHPGCKEWGGFGFTRGKHGVTHWFCDDHRDEGERYL